MRSQSAPTTTLRAKSIVASLSLGCSFRCSQSVIATLLVSITRNPFACAPITERSIGCHCRPWGFQWHNRVYITDRLIDVEMKYVTAVQDDDNANMHGQFWRDYAAVYGLPRYNVLKDANITMSSSVFPARGNQHEETNTIASQHSVYVIL